MSIASFSLFLTGTFFLVAGIQFIRGKWLFLLAGNNFGQATNKEATRAGRIVGLIFLLTFLLCITIMFSIIYDFRLTFLPVIMGIVLLYSYVVIIRYIVHWIKNG
ncbi:hypothetical protein A5819_002382 [Enterococcus sp. 7E2_DIV0204]|uniref:hypothetical protein n=1 Tax=unclassified Enterococcus TaxID=2608891 RepID=UPI000A33F481|nr:MULTISPECIES: hypothetical protein [unclassified Enterococcus]OTN89884.1 hypothetical protein A5819_002382 [Enterococcus sp. 7E2_DIV0204]OTP52340.1 hypothetical protein A5884_001541 [Enterococcus sp. 7D2_DIV0200]